MCAAQVVWVWLTTNPQDVYLLLLALLPILDVIISSPKVIRVTFTAMRVNVTVMRVSVSVIRAVVSVSASVMFRFRKCMA